LRRGILEFLFTHYARPHTKIPIVPVERIRRKEGLKVPQKQPKRGRLWLNDGFCIRLRPEYPGHVWAYDFVEGRTHDGRKFRILTIIDAGVRIPSKRDRRSVIGPCPALSHRDEVPPERRCAR
jgi:hypothetical protein